jgi:DNA-binding ferritin-like protein
MKNLAITFRSAQLIAQNFHNMVSGPSFFSDHKFLGGIYENYAESYDATVERMIGTGKAPDLVEINKRAAEIASGVNPSITALEMFSKISEIEKAIRSEVRLTFVSETTGTQNMLQQFSDDSEARSYKINQRIGPG